MKALIIKQGFPCCDLDDLDSILQKLQLQDLKNPEVIERVEKEGLFYNEEAMTEVIELPYDFNVVWREANNGYGDPYLYTEIKASKEVVASLAKEGKVEELLSYLEAVNAFN